MFYEKRLNFSAVQFHINNYTPTDTKPFSKLFLR